MPRLFIGIMSNAKEPTEKYYLVTHLWRPEKETWRLSYVREFKRKPDERVDHHVTLEQGHWSCSCEASNFAVARRCKHILAIMELKQTGMLK